MAVTPGAAIVSTCELRSLTIFPSDAMKGGCCASFLLNDSETRRDSSIKVYHFWRAEFQIACFPYLPNDQR